MINQSIIVGGGIVGSCMALKLAKAKYGSVLIDIKAKRSEHEWQQQLSQRDSRVFALNLASINLLKEIGVWEYIKKLHRKVDYTQIHVWQTNGFGELNFAENSDTLRIGSIIEPSLIEYALHQRMQDSDVKKYIELIDNKQLIAIDSTLNPHDNSIGYAVTLNDGSIVNGSLLIGADGRNSTIRELSAIELDTLDYDQKAICCAIKTEKPHEFTARQAMLPTGTLAFLPLADINKSNIDNQWQSVVWTLPNYLAIEMLMLDDDELAKELALASTYELGDVLKIESISSFPLVARQAKTYIKPKLVLIGDAAHSIHPLAGQGLNLGLADVASLFANLDNDNKRMSQLKIPNAWGHWHTLQKYERERRAKNSQMMHGCSVLNWTFAGQFAQLSPLLQLRSEGMAMVNKNRWLMNWFNHQAGGL